MAFINSQRHIGTVGLQDPETLGGTETFYSNFKIHTFLTSGTFTILGSENVTCDVLNVAGGGGGAGNQGGGGAGGMVIQPTLVIAPGVYNIVVGNGGTASSAGFNSTCQFTGVADAIGGGFNNGAGGSGSGGGTSGQGGGAGTAGQGNNGGGGANCGAVTGGGGGGGAGAAGAGAPGFGGCPGCGGCTGGGSGVGGVGLENLYRTGSNIFYAGGGGGGGGNVSGNGGNSAGGNGGGGQTGSSPGVADGVINTGGGGHGQGSGATAGTGGRGIVVIRAPFPIV